MHLWAYNNVLPTSLDVLQFLDYHEHSTHSKPFENQTNHSQKMADALRQDTSDKATSALKPESQKSTLETIGDKVKGAGDSAAGTVQPGEKFAP